MGCGISRIDQTVGGGGGGGGGGVSQWRPCSIIPRKSAPSIADDSLLLKPMPEDPGEGEDNAKGGGKVYSDHHHHHHKEENVEDDGQQSLPQLLSFRVYCTSSLEDDNKSQGSSCNAENVTEKQEGDVDHQRKQDCDVVDHRKTLEEGLDHQKKQERDVDHCKKEEKVVDHHKKQEGDGDCNKGSTQHNRMAGLRARIGKGFKSLRTS